MRQGTAKFEQRTQTAGTTTAGGFTVPTELANEIVKSMLAWGPMYDGDVARVITSSAGNPMKVPTVNDTAKSAGAHTEGAALTDDGSEDVTFGQKSLDAYVFDTEFIRWSFELESDSIFSMEALLADLLGERLGRIANAQLTTGTGSSAPNGVVTASTLGKTAASATALTCDELIDLEHSVNRAYRKSPKAAFMMNDLTVKAVRKLKNSDGDYIWSAGDVTQGRPATLLGYKLNVNDSMADIATGQKTVLFGDFNKYFVRKVGSPVIGVLRERFWPDLGIAGLIRFDGELADTAAIKHLIQA
ncbi:phage major capsid protein [Rhizobium laguerreae]